MKMKIPVSRFYQVRVPNRSEWARIWITDDGCITTISDHGNYGYWFGAPGCEFRKFLTGCGDDYILNKLSAGERDVNHSLTLAAVRKKLWDMMGDGDIGKGEADEEEAQLDDVDFANGESRGMWFSRTRLDAMTASECIVREYPIQVQMFVKVLWPLFVAQLRMELSAEADAAAALEAAL